MKVLLMTIQNAPPGLYYDHDKKFSKSFKEMVAMCLVKDQTKRPTAEKLLKHSFFKHAKPLELSVKILFADLPPIWNCVKALQLKDAAQLALKKMPSAEQEAISQVCDYDDILDTREDDESMKSFVHDRAAIGFQFNFGKSSSMNELPQDERRGLKDELQQTEFLNKRGKTLEADSLESGFWQNIVLKKNGSNTEVMAAASEKETTQTKVKTVKGRQTQSGPLMPNMVLNHSSSEKGRASERCENENNHELRKLIGKSEEHQALAVL